MPPTRASTRKRTSSSLANNGGASTLISQARDQGETRAIAEKDDDAAVVGVPDTTDAHEHASTRSAAHADVEIIHTSTSSSAWEHANFFDALITMFPPHIYLAESYKDHDAVPVQFMKKHDKLEAKAASKANSKAAKRRKLNPDAARTTLDILQNQNGTTTASEGRADDAPSRAVPSLAASRDELRERLAKRLEEMRSQRKAAEREAQAKDALAFRKQTQQPPKPKSKQPAKQQTGQQNGGATTTAAIPTAEEVDPELQFNRLRVESRASEFVDKAVERKRQRNREEKRSRRRGDGDGDGDGDGGGDGDGDDGTHDWSTAMRRAAGERVLDDPKALKKALRREEKRKEKARGKWASRVEGQEKRQRDAQEKRQKNLKLRRDAKKSRKIAKRDKKLADRGGPGAAFGASARPGFEGRKTLV
ncbi:ribosomal RNA-processing protein 14/surfeit locus protein 6 C-terminal domain-containing protein [Pseudoscourfieldia marina]